MSIETFLAVILPLLAFVLIEMRYGVRAGAVAAIFAMVAASAFVYVRTGYFDPFVTVEFGLLVVLAGLSFRSSSPRYLRLQPAIVGLVLSSYIFILQVFVEPLFLRMQSTMVALSPELETILQRPGMDQLMAHLSLDCGIVIFLHALLMVYTGLYAGRWLWFWSRLFIYPALLIAVIVRTATYGIIN